LIGRFLTADLAAVALRFDDLFLGFTSDLSLTTGSLLFPAAVRGRRRTRGRTVLADASADWETALRRRVVFFSDFMASEKMRTNRPETTPSASLCATRNWP